MQKKAELLKQAIIDRIRSGAYPVGSRLPSLRSAATEFGVHPNTAAKVYGQLADYGIVRMVHGAGTFVLSMPPVEFEGVAIDKLFNGLQEQALQARRLGLSRLEWARLVADAEAAAYAEEDTLSMWFVECSPPDTSELASSLTALLERPVRPMIVDNVHHHIVSRPAGNDLFITTPFHAEEVESAVADKGPVVNVNVVPTSNTLIRFARISERARVSVIASNQATLERFVRMLRAYVRRDPSEAVLVDSVEAERVARHAEVLVDSQSIHDRVLDWKPRGDVITVKYQIEPTSLAFLREVLKTRSIERLTVGRG
jgi:DNA-binding transcriptional regulator YhcF (GntR family)